MAHNSAKKKKVTNHGPLERSKGSLCTLNIISIFLFIVGPSWFGTMKTFQFFFSVLITANKNVLTSVTGGLLGNDVYVFQEATFYWSPNFRSSAANDIDGIG